MNYSRVVVGWLYVGLFMVFCQIIIGGVTRLTGSGLSITKWEIVTGTLPPLNDEGWKDEFNKYQETPQYEKLNKGMSLSEFKFIYFWEYFHRLWARIMGIVFIVPFLLFYAKGMIARNMLTDLGVVILLAAMAACFGWIMVASGLIDRPWVNAYKLSIHLLLGIAVFLALLWTILKYRFGSLNRNGFINHYSKFSIAIFVVVIGQIVFGGWMSGMKAALIYPTWPDIGGYLLPPDVLDLDNWSIYNLVHYDETSFVFGLVHFLHRSTAYIILIMIVVYAVKYKIRAKKNDVLYSFVVFLTCLLVQIIIGVVTLLKSIGMVPVFWGVLHQACAVVVIGSLLVHIYFVKLYDGTEEIMN